MGCGLYRNCSESNGVEICSAIVGEGAAEVSINPLNWKQFVLFGPSRLCLWNMEHCGSDKLLTPLLVQLVNITFSLEAVSLALLRLSFSFSDWCLQYFE